REMGELKSVTFLFDAIVTKLELKNVKVENPKQLIVSIKLPQREWKIGPSRINVTDFAATGTQEIHSTPEQMCQLLGKRGLQIKASYDGSNLGSGTMSFPQDFLDMIGPSMKDLLHIEIINLMRGNAETECVGTVTLFMRLTIKCKDKSETSLPRAPEKIRSCACCYGNEKTINPEDIMFLVGNSDPGVQVPSEPCSELSEAKADARLRLDLDRYRSRQNRRVVLPDDLPPAEEKPSLRQLKQVTNRFAKIIDSLSTKMRKKGLPMCPVAPLEKSSESSGFRKCLSRERWIPVPIESDEHYGVKPIRFCPVCLCSMSWLPKYAKCPRCHTAFGPALEEGMDGNRPTAEQIMDEHLIKPQPKPGAEDFCPRNPCDKDTDYHVQDKEIDTEMDKELDKCRPCRCTCKYGKTCAHCRIRKLCGDIYRQSVQTTKQVQIKPSSEDQASDDVPYLTRVFSEMARLLTLHETNKKKNLGRLCRTKSMFTVKPPNLSATVAPRVVKSLPTCAIGTITRKRAVHKQCRPSEGIVSRRHGWNWTKTTEARENGWRPGAILRTSGVVMRFFLKRRNSHLHSEKFLAEVKTRERMRDPVLNVCKRNGVLYITLRSLGNLKKQQKPIVFRIVKSDLAVALREIKRTLKDLGFRKCTCHKPLMLCVCRDPMEKLQMNKALKKECRKRNMQPCPEELVLTDTSISDVELDLNITPPVEIRRRPQRVLRNAVNHGTQTTTKNGRKITPEYPKRYDPYTRAVNCATGSQFTNTAFGDSPENVFEDGVFGLEGGGAHG
ncbi:hypothetical protein KR018_007535, partial [Drosophila ironensis]